VAFAGAPPEPPEHLPTSYDQARETRTFVRSANGSSVA
jgi:hypothetical protein